MLDAMVKNAFGLIKYSPKDLFEDARLVGSIEVVLKTWLRFLDINEIEAGKLVKYTIDSCKKSTLHSDDLARELIEEYSKLKVVETMINKMGGRADLILSYLQPYRPTSANPNIYRILDIGTGPGKVGKRVWEEGYAVRLHDVVLKDGDKRAEDVKELEHHAKRPLLYDLHKDTPPLQYANNEFDMSLLITVLHHCADPLGVLSEAARVTKESGRIAVLESVYDITKSELPDDVYAINKPAYDAFFNLSAAQQKKYGTFLDWFLNKLSFRNDAVVPCNFNSPKNWEKIFAQHGLKVIGKKVVGIDQPVTPEFHVFYMLEKK